MRVGAMKNLACLSLSSFTLASLVTLVVGCSSGGTSDPFGAEPDYAAVQQRLHSPTGTLDAQNMSSVFSRYSNQQSSNASANVFGASASSASDGAVSTGGVRSRALRILSGQSGLTASCSAFVAGQSAGSCTCPNGGSFTYDFSSLAAFQQPGSSSGPIDGSLKARFDGCRENDVGIDGREFVHFHADGGGSQLDLNSLELILVADFQLTKGSDTLKVDLEAILQNGELEIAIQVDDGWITVRASSSGTTSGFVVRDRNGTWSCDVANNSGSCVDEHGVSRKF
jgi:hypothetical protein